MARYTLQNEQLSLEFDSRGAELVRLYGRNTKREYLFDADPAYWKRHSPVLFPLVGSLKNKQYLYRDKTYEMSQHGFARDMEFVCSSRTEDTIWFTLDASPETKAVYPFDFRLSIGYQLCGTCVHVLWRVENTGSEEMYFSIGAHPAFYCNMTEEAGEQTDRLLVGEHPEESVVYYHISAQGLALPEDCERLQCDTPVTAELFRRDAIIVDGKQADRLALAGPDHQEYVVLHFDAPLFGVWAPRADAPFVCLEPWYGRCDAEDFEGTLEQREHGNQLELGGCFEAQYSIGLPLEKAEE